jgi:hypothetical protein
MYIYNKEKEEEMKMMMMKRAALRRKTYTKSQIYTVQQDAAIVLREHTGTLLRSSA